MRILATKKPEPVIPVAAMSDIAFLLIIFFMVTTVFLREGHIKFKLPAAEETVQTRTEKISVTVDVDGIAYVNGVQQNNILQTLRNILENRIETNREVFFKCDKGVVKQKYLPIIEQINEAGGQLMLITEDEAATKKEEEPAESPAPAKGEPAAAPEPAAKTPPSMPKPKMPEDDFPWDE